MKQRSPRLRRQVLMVFRAQALTSTVRHAASSDHLCEFADGDSPIVIQEEVGQGGLCGRLRSNPSSKLLHAGRRRRELIAPPQTDFPTIFRPASGARSASPFKHSSQGIPIGTKTLTDNPLWFLIPTQINNVPEYGVQGFQQLSDLIHPLRT